MHGEQVVVVVIPAALVVAALFLLGSVCAKTGDTHTPIQTNRMR